MNEIKINRIDKFEDKSISFNIDDSDKKNLEVWNDGLFKNLLKMFDRPLSKDLINDNKYISIDSRLKNNGIYKYIKEEVGDDEMKKIFAIMECLKNDDTPESNTSESKKNQQKGGADDQNEEDLGGELIVLENTDNEVEFFQGIENENKIEFGCFLVTIMLLITFSISLLMMNAKLNQYSDEVGASEVIPTLQQIRDLQQNHADGLPTLDFLYETVSVGSKFFINKAMGTIVKRTHEFYNCAGESDATRAGAFILLGLDQMTGGRLLPDSLNPTTSIRNCYRLERERRLTVVNHEIHVFASYAYLCLFLMHYTTNRIEGMRNLKTKIASFLRTNRIGNIVFSNIVTAGGVAGALKYYIDMQQMTANNIATNLCMTSGHSCDIPRLQGGKRSKTRRGKRVKKTHAKKTSSKKNHTKKKRKHSNKRKSKRR